MKVKAGILVMKGLSRDASRDKKMGKGVWGRVNHNSGSTEIHKKAYSTRSSENITIKSCLKEDTLCGWIKNCSQKPPVIK